jgi:hypothetical protein
MFNIDGVDIIGTRREHISNKVLNIDGVNIMRQRACSTASCSAAFSAATARVFIAALETSKAIEIILRIKSVTWFRVKV